MKNTAAVLVGALTSAACHGGSVTQAKPPAPATRASEKTMEPERGQASVITGTVTFVDAKAGTLALKTKDKALNLTADSRSAKAALEKLKAGDTAKVFERAGKVIAVSPVNAESTKTPK